MVSFLLSNGTRSLRVERTKNEQTTEYTSGDTKRNARLKCEKINSWYLIHLSEKHRTITKT